MTATTQAVLGALSILLTLESVKAGSARIIAEYQERASLLELEFSRMAS